MSSGFDDDQMRKMLDRLTEISRNTGGTLARGYQNSNSGTAGGNASTAASQTALQKNLKASSDSLNKFNQSAGAASSAFNQYTKSVGGLMSGIEAFAKVFGAGALASQITKSLTSTIKVYQDMINSGQSFNGSMMEMQLAASNAAIPLDEFARVVKANSLVIAATGTKSFLDLNKALRSNLLDMGMLGYNTSQLNDFMGEYLETQRLYGNLSNFNSDRAAKSLSNLALETTKVANLTGKNREEITKTAQNALKDETLRAKFMQMSGNSTEGFNDSLQKAMVYMAGLPKIAGDTLSRMLAQTVGRGSSLLTDDMQTFIDAGLFGVNSLVDGIKDKIESGTVTDTDLAQFYKDFVSEGKKNMASLQFQAATGNQAAKKTIEILSEMNSIAEKTPEALGKQKRFTDVLTKLEENMNRFNGDLKTRFLTGVSGMLDGIEKFIDSDAFKQLSARFSDLAERFGKFLSDYFTPEKLEGIGNGLLTFAEGLSNAFVTITKWSEPLFAAFNALTEKMGLLGAVIATILIYKGVKAGAGAIMGRGKKALGEKFDIGSLTGGGEFNDFAESVGGRKALRVVVANMGSLGGGNSDILDDMDKGKGKGGKPGTPGKKPSRWGRLKGKLPGIGGALSLGLGAYSAYNLLNSDASKKDKTEGLGGIAGGAAGGAIGAWAGGALGSLLFGAGAIPGAMLGGYLGNLAGDWLGSKAATSFTGDSSVPDGTPVPSISPDNASTQMAEMQKTQQRMQQENAELKMQVNKLMDVIAQNGNQTVGGLKEMIDETKKSNRNLEAMSGSLF